MEKQSPCQKLGIILHHFRSGSLWGIQSASGLNPCRVWTSLCKNMSCTGSPVSLEVTGITAFVVILSSSLKISPHPFCVSAWSCPPPSSSEFAEQQESCIFFFLRSFIYFCFSLPLVVFVLHLDFWLFIQPLNRNI